MSAASPMRRGGLPGVTVDLHSYGTETTAITDGTGDYRIEDVPAGPVELTFKLINFTVVRRTLNVIAGETVTADAVLGLSLTADIVVTGTRTFRNIADLENPAENLVGVASAASQGAITAKQLEARPIMRPAEVLEAVPGLIASQHSGEGKANPSSSAACSSRRVRTTLKTATFRRRVPRT